MLFAPPTDGNVIKKTNVQNSCGFVDLASQPEIGITGIWIPGLPCPVLRRGIKTHFLLRVP
jgi:hypothetical protein